MRPRSAFAPREILFLTDLSPMADHAFQHALMLARLFAAKLHVLYALETIGYTWTLPRFRTLTAPARGKAEGATPDPNLRELNQRLWLDQMSPQEAVAVLTREHPIGLVVVSLHSRQASERMLFGSVAEQVFQGSRSPLWIIGPHCQAALAEGPEYRSQQLWPAPPRQLLCAVTIPPGEREGEVAAALAERGGARLNLLHILASQADEQAEALCREQLQGVLPALPAAVPERLLVARAASPASGILVAASERFADLIVLGVRELSGWTLMGGGTAAAVIDKALCPVLVVPEPAQRALERPRPPERTALLATSATSPKTPLHLLEAGQPGAGAPMARRRRPARSSGSSD